MGRGRHALEDARLAQRPWPLQLLADRLDPGRDLFEFFTLNPGPTLQHGTDFPKFLSRGLKATFALGNIETYPQDFIYPTLIVVDAFVGPEYPDFLIVAQYVLIDTEGVAVRVALQPIQKAVLISVFKPASGCQCAEHRFACDLLGGISEELFAIMIDRSDFAFGVQAQNNGIDFELGRRRQNHFCQSLWRRVLRIFRQGDHRQTDARHTDTR